MYVCICNAVSDRAVRAAIDDGASSIADLMVACDAGTGCGTCHVELERMLTGLACAPRPSGTERQLQRS